MNQRREEGKKEIVYDKENDKGYFLKEYLKNVSSSTIDPF